MPETLRDSVRAFLRDHIASYEQLELLLLLRRRPDGVWTRAELAEHLTASAEELELAVRALRRAGIIEQTPGPETIRYAPRSAAQHADIDGLAAAYEEKPLAIIKLMNANAIERVRSAAISTFADAFVLGRKKDG